jgi:hypothetical protein
MAKSARRANGDTPRLSREETLKLILANGGRSSDQPYVEKTGKPRAHANGHSKKRLLRFIDLFCGIGGFRLAFERAGAKCVFSSDWDKFSRQT